jgi:hypothetical protein
MSNEEKSKVRPSHQVSFARITGRDEDGRETLGPARQIGAIWPRAGKDGEGILRLDHMPEELRAGGGVVFVRKIDELREGRPEPKGRDRDRDRGR